MDRDKSCCILSRYLLQSLAAYEKTCDYFPSGNVTGIKYLSENLGWAQKLLNGINSLNGSCVNCAFVSLLTYNRTQCTWQLFGRLLGKKNCKNFSHNDSLWLFITQMEINFAFLKWRGKAQVGKFCCRTSFP